MYKKALFIFMLYSSFLFSQNETITFTNSLKTSSTLLKGAIPIVNQKNEDVSLFLMDSKKIYGYLFDSNFDIKRELSSEKRSRKYKELIGYSISENNDYRLFLTNTTHNRFATINFSYANNSSTLKELDLKFTNEIFLQTVVFENKFHLITIIKDTSILVLYTFNDTGDFKKSMINLSDKKFINGKNKTVNLYRTLANGYSKSIEINKIEEDNPNSIELTSEYTKMYLRERQVVFTIDWNKNFTQIITIDLNSFSASVKQIQKPFVAVKKGLKKTNSYLFGEYIFMIASTDARFTFTVQDYTSSETLKKYLAISKDTISFKNTPIIQTGGMYDDYREMEKTRKFLRKITKKNIGVSVHKMGENYQITLGGKIEIKSGGMMMPMGFGGIPVASFGAISVFINPAFFAYNSYTNTKSTYIKGLFDKNFNHLKGEIQDNVFDRISIYQDNASTSQNGETVFKYKDYYIYGHYISSDKDYRLVKFKD